MTESPLNRPPINQAPSALLLIATNCSHCPSVLQSLSELIKEGKLSSLEVVNIVEAPERAQAMNVRSVPWVKLGEFELTGMKTKTELQQWIEKSTKTDSHPEDMAAYFEELMTSGELTKVQQIIEQQPQRMQTLFDIMADENASLSARIGVGAIIESLAGDALLINNIEVLAKYLNDKNARIRNDACYYLGLSHHPRAAPFISPLLKDEDKDVRETAEEALQDIQINS